jgi:ATP-binding cassette, subfamily B, bacterial CvaB/MchF/RaxB
MAKSVPLILQTEASECGLASLAMVARYHGFDCDLNYLRRRYQASLRGMTMAQIVRIGESLNLAHRPLRVEMSALKQLQTPAILHWDFNHFVVLVSVTANKVVINDPARGRRTLTHAEVSRRFTGIAVEFSPTKEFKPERARTPLRVSQLWTQSSGLTRTLLHVLALSLVIEFFAVLIPLFLQIVVDQVVVSADRDLLTVIGVGFVLLAIFHALTTWVRGWAVTHLSTKLNVQLVTNLFAHLLRLPLNFFERRHIGDLVSRFSSVDFIQRTLTTSFLEAVIDGLMVIVTLGMMLLYSVKLTLVAVGAAALYCVLRWVLYRPLRDATDEQLVHASKQQTHFIETMRGMQAVKLFNAQGSRTSVWQNTLVDNINAQVRMQHLTVAWRGGNTLLFGIENVVVIWMGALLVLGSAGFSLGMLYAFLAYKLQFITRIGNLIDKAIEFKMLGLHLDRIADIALAQPEPRIEGAATLETQREFAHTGLEVRNLSYQHGPTEPFVFQNVSFSVAPGQLLAITGPSGVGKTTLTKVLLGLLPATEGDVVAGGVEIKQMGTEAWRERVGAVMQDDQLFMGSIADNICMFEATFDQARIEEAAKRVGLHDDILRLPMGYNTLIANMGTNLSGGQRQRLYLARALYRRPVFLFLDEATNQLDREREQQVMDTVRTLGLTTVVIAHRESTIRMADAVIQLDSSSQSSVTRTLPGSAQ